ncbi:MAG TPA: RHS repeat-associated core domain-containing protein [Bacteroidia bacterium]|nr:RHS repeat-associated core domain-containing protein [Bacteroidia bacterium]
MPSNQNVINAAEYLCNQNIIEDFQDGSNPGLTNLPLDELAFYTSNALLGYGVGSVTDSYPSPIIDLQSNDPYTNAVKRLSYLEYSSDIPCLSRDYFYVGAADQIEFGRGVKTILKAFNITPNFNDSIGYNPADNSPSNFICEVLNSNKYYPWLKRAYNLGLFSEILQPCGNCVAGYCWVTIGGSNNVMMDKWELFIILANIKQTISTPSVSNSDYFVPNSFTSLTNSGNSSIKNGVFNSYNKNSFSIPGGGLPLEFSHSYYSQLTELPFMSQPYYDADYFFQRVFPIGKGWTHNYNIYIHSITETFTAPYSNDQKLVISWADGSNDIYNYSTQQYITNGVSDVITIDNFSPSNPFNANQLTITKKDGTQFVFIRDPGIITFFRLVKIRNRNGKVLYLNHNFSQSGNFIFSQLVSVTDSLSGRRLLFNYQAGTNFISSVEDDVWGNRTIYFNVNSTSGNLESFIDAKGQTTTYQYISEPNLLTSIVLPKGNTITNTYYNRKLQSTQAGSYGIQVNWGQNYLGGGSTNSTVSVTQNGNTLTTSYVHDNRGNPTSITTPTGTVTMQYADSNNPDDPTQIVDSNTGITTNIQYEPNKKANPIFVSKSSGGNTITEQFQYNNFSQVTQHTDPDGNITHTLYDANGNITDLIKPIGSTHFNYNANKLVESIVDPVGLTTNFHYNLYGNLDSLSIAGTNISASATYDNISRITGIRNPNGIRTGFTYDNNDNLLSKRYDSLGVNYLTQNVYDPNDNLTTINSPRGLPTILTYDSTDALRTETYWSFSKQWDYNQDGTIKTFRNKNNSLFSYSYLATGDPNAGKLQNDGYAGYEYYTSDKNLWKVSRGGKDIRYGYDAFSRVTDVTYTDLPGSQNDVQYVYYPNSNRLQKIDYPSLGGISLTLEYTYDANNRLKRVKNVSNGNIYVDYTYRNDDKLLTEVFGNGTRTFYYYDNASRLDSIVTKKQNGDVIATITCERDAVGNHTREYTNAPYIGPNNPPGFSLQDTAFNYQYDNMNRLASANSATYISNPNGAVLSNNLQVYSCTWDERDNMLSLTRNGTTKSFDYDGLENRRLNDSTRYIIDILHNENVLMETNLSGDPTSVYVHGLGLVCKIDPLTNHVYYYHYDFRGSTIAISDSTQEVIQNYVYSAYGKIKNSQGHYLPQNKNPFTYVGKHGVIDEGNSIYFMRARYYDGNIGRFISEDPKWDINLFPYADNNPVTKIDPNGEVAFLVPLLGAAGSSIATGYLYAKASGQEYTWKHAALDGALGIATAGASMYLKAGRAGAGALKTINARNYRQNLRIYTGSSGSGMDAHHVFPQAKRFQTQWTRVGLNIHHPKNLTWWSRSAHRSLSNSYNKKWDKFFKINPKATLEEIQDFGKNVMNDFGF